MTGFTVLLMLALGGATWFFLDTASARDSARYHARRVCKDLGVQLLDQTVALSGTGLNRRVGGGLTVERRFRFEFSETGSDRCPGQLIIRGGIPVRVVLDGERIGRVVMGANSGSG